MTRRSRTCVPGGLVTVAIALGWMAAGIGPPRQAAAGETAAAVAEVDPSIAKEAARWERDVLRFEERERKTPTPAGAVLFLGSSNITLWNTLAEDFPDHVVVNRGFGGCRLADIAFFAERLVGRLQPSVIVVSAGSNDIHGGRSPEQVRDAFIAFVTTARSLLPDVRIIYLGIAATTARLSERPAQERAFALIEEFVATQDRMEAIDLADVYCLPDGTIDPECLIADKLHPSRKGNRLRAAIIRDRLGPAAKR